MTPKRALKQLAAIALYVAFVWAMVALTAPGGPLIDAAPALVPKGDAVVGVLETRLESPTVVIRKEHPEPDLVFWLVFPTPLLEADAKRLESGTRTRVVGRLMAGGVYRYIVVESIGPDRE